MTKLKSEQHIRFHFWESYASKISKKDNRKYAYMIAEGKTQNHFPCDVRVAFVDHVDWLHREGLISDELAQSVTL